MSVFHWLILPANVAMMMTRSYYLLCALHTLSMLSVRTATALVASWDQLVRDGLPTRSRQLRSTKPKLDSTPRARTIFLWDHKHGSRKEGNSNGNGNVNRKGAILYHQYKPIRISV
ncbi:hypothetical protein GGR50DRAFT_541770 [Xylaria sp. CBS 124048]|nr:hypothetical protein GGR50DRAFT_541770 [Xylaria sp. CBS 124048]